MIDLEDLLQKLELTVRMGKKSIFSDMVSVNPNDIYKIVAAIRDNLPEMMQEAHAIVERRDRILSEEKLKAQTLIQNAERRANELLTEAKEEARKMLSEDELLVAATEQSHSIRAEALDFAASIKAEARSNVLSLFEKTARFLQAEYAETTQVIDDIKRMPIHPKSDDAE